MNKEEDNFTSLYEVSYMGHYPIGAYAIVAAKNADHAKIRFLSKLKRESEYLYNKNKNSRHVTIERIELTIGEPCHIISDGDY